MTPRLVGFAVALVALTGVARAQGRPYAFTVPFSDGDPRTIVRYDGGMGNASFDPGADHVEQTAEIDYAVGSRVLVMATEGVALGGPSQFRDLGRLEAIFDVVRFAGWHLAASGGVEHQYDGSGLLLSRLSLSRTTSTWSVAANALVGKSYLGPDAIAHVPTQLDLSLGATAKISSIVSLGAEGVMSGDAKTAFYGPLMSFALPHRVARITVSGGPVVRALGQISQSYLMRDNTHTILPSDNLVGIGMPQIGYSVRLAVTVGL
jgi:hypothetical protein